MSTALNRDDFFRLEKKDGIATIWIPVKSEKVNII